MMRLQNLTLFIGLTIGIQGSSLSSQEQSQYQQRLLQRSTDSSTIGPLARRLLDKRQTEDALPDIDLSPDGRRVAYINTSNGGVYVRELISGVVRQVASGQPAYWNYSPVWSADGNQLAFSTEDMSTWTISVKIVNLQSNETTVVIDPLRDRFIKVDEWSKDCRYLLCHYAPQIALIAVDDGSISILADSLNLNHGSLSPDSRFVSYAFGDGDNSQIFIQPVRGSTRRQITFTAGGNNHPLWSPDGRAIAYQNRFGIWLVPIINGEPTGDPQMVISATNIMLRCWTESGLCYSQFTDAGQRSVPYVITMDPGTGRSASDGVRVLSSYFPDSISVFAWSPDMRRIILAHRLSPNVTITSMNPRSVVTWDLGRSGHVHRPLWSSDGREILYEPDAQFWGNQGSTVVALDVATGHVRELFPRTRREGSFSLSADAKIISFYRYADNVGVAIPVWPSAGSKVESLVVAATGQSNERIVATLEDSCAEPFSSALRPMLTAKGDRVLYVRQVAIGEPQIATPKAASLWVVSSNGLDARQLATAAFIQSAIWDPTGRFIAYTAKPEIAAGSTVLCVIEVATGTETEIPLPVPIGRRIGFYDFVRAVHWSSDGRLLGIIAGHDFDSGWEFWVLQGLQDH